MLELHRAQNCASFRFTRRPQRGALAAAAAAVLLLLPAGSPAQEEAASGPVVRERVTPQVVTTDTRAIARRAPVKRWRSGDPVRLVEDLRDGGEPGTGGYPGEGGEPGPGPAPTERTPVAPLESDRDVRTLPPARRWQPGDPLRVVEDLRRLGPGAAGAAPSVAASFDGIPATGFLPPDTVGDVGPDHYIQMVNSAFAIYDKAGTLLAGPVAINSLWSGFGGPCESENSGDPVVRYDHLADRWLLSQFALPRGQEHECIAVSRTPDPVAGGWYLYAFPTVDLGTGQSVFPDYPKIGVWPDAYYMGTQRGFFGGGLDVWAFERQRMLAGDSAGVVQFHVPAVRSLFLMPSDLDGPPPPAGTPNFFTRQVDGERFGGEDRLEIFAFSVDWANPAASTFTQVGTLPVASFDSVLCSADLLGACVPQPGVSQRLETLTVWLMWRAQYRNFGDHEALVTNHTVDADGRDLAGVRWYELRRQPGGAWFLFQQGTQSPDRVHRWMGSVAMNGEGEMALGYSVSSDSVFPGIRAATRTASDPPGSLPEEIELVTGGGAQTYAIPRWGNYSSMDVDPVDDCTFWYTTEYYDTTSQGGWKTHVSSFRLPSCGNGPAAESEGFQYAAKIVCGVQRRRTDLRLARGLYATTINIHNPQAEPVSFTKKLALTLPPPEQRPGEVLPIAEDQLGPGEALKTDCEDLRRRLFPGGFPGGVIEGFVVIDSPMSLDVTGVYSTAALGCFGRPSRHSSIEVHAVPERRVEAPAPPGGTCPDLVVRDIGPPDVSCPGGGGTCVTIVKYTVANVGDADAGPFSIEVVLDPAGSVVVQQPVAAGLAAGASQTFTAISPAGGNCFDPDCTVCVVMDSKGEVSECEEANNKSCETTPG